MKTLLLIMVLLCSWPQTIANANPQRIVHKAIPQKELDCLIRNAFHEAHSEGKTGRKLVTQVVFNRTTGEKFCNTIYKPYQFSWTLSAKKRKERIPNKIYLEIQSEILELYYGFSEVPRHLAGATHYHNTDVRPAWSRSLEKMGKWKNHIFYQA